MKVTTLKITYEAEICAQEKDIPTMGQVFLDDNDHEWTVRGVAEDKRIMFRNPPPPWPTWIVTLEGQHPAYTLERNSKLRLK